MLHLRLTARFFFIVLISIMISTVSTAQTVTGSISGVVTDPNGGLIPGANITLISEQSGAVRNTVTNDEGRFLFSTLQPGPYTIKIEQQGFQTLQRTNTILSANETLALGELKLTAGNVSEVVTVQSSGATVETETSDLTARLTSDQIDLISTKGRDITSLLRLIPGTTNENDVEAVGEGFGTDLPFISGQRGRSTVPTVDGLNAGEPSGSNKVSMSTSQDAIAEVKVLRNNYAAEYGNNGGAIISIVSKGGTKSYRGSAYYFIRNEALNASPFFINKQGLEKPLYRHNIWGFNYGGPLPLPRFGETDHMFLRNKAYFFVNYERPHTITPTDVVTVTVPTAAERAGDFSHSYTSSGPLLFLADPLAITAKSLCQATPTSNPDPTINYQGACFHDPSRATAANPTGMNIIPLNRFNPSTAALLNVFPLPNTDVRGTNGIPLYNFVTQRSVDVPKHSLLIRFDVNPTSNDHIFWKRQWFTSDNVGLGTSGWPSGDQNRWGILSHYLYKDNGWSANWAHIFSKNIVNEFNFGMRHDSEGFIPDNSIIPLVSRNTYNYTAPQLFPENNTLGTIPRVTSWSGIPGTPAQINWLTRWGAIGNDFVQPAFSDNLSYILKNHSLKFGMYFERLLNGEAAGSNWSGTLSFTNSASSWSAAQGNTGDPYATAILGYFQSYGEDQFRPHTNIEQDMLQWFAQDQWKVNRRLTLNYGMRFGWHTPFYQRDNVGSSFDPSLFNAANPARFYLPVCTVALPSNGNSCPTASRRVVDPAFPNVFLTNLNLNRTYVPGSGDLLNGLQLARDPNTPKGYREFNHLVDLEPRIGIAYDLTGKGKTVLRGMVGVYHTPRAGGGTTGDLTQNPPEQRSWTVTNGNIQDLESLFAQVQAASPIFPWGSVRGLEIHTHTPEIYNFSFGVQQDIGWGTVVEASYVGSRGRWLGEQRDINQIPDGSRFVNCNLALVLNVTCHPENRDPFANLSTSSITGGALNDDFLRPFRGFGDTINYVTFSGNSRYDSLQVQVNRRYAQGFQYGVAYTWSKSVDDTSDDRDGLVYAVGSAFGGRDYTKFNFAPSDFDQRHVFAVNYIWDIPFFNRGGNSFVRTLLGGWILSGTTTFATGKPKDVSVSYSSSTVTLSPGFTCPVGSFSPTGSTTTCAAITDFTGGSTNAFPFVVCDPTKANGHNSEGTPLFVNEGCFVRPTKLGEIGDRARNVLRRPAIFNTDIALFKNFKWGERRSIQLRWETYNVFNHTNFSDIDSSLTYALIQLQTNPRKPDGTVNPCFNGSNGMAGVPNNICSAEYQQTNSSFGAASAARSPRVMQASIRINF